MRTLFDFSEEPKGETVRVRSIQPKRAPIILRPKGDYVTYFTGSRDVTIRLPDEVSLKEQEGREKAERLLLQALEATRRRDYGKAKEAACWAMSWLGGALYAVAGSHGCVQDGGNA